ncbi:ParA family protein [Roseomonas sp. NAR14]|uniref:ParA family protein n=1 Tax=Roseomonas acroporae TaxID=2937791 RepID=A0A9X1Y8X6_9PROT|nr:ParA family partition ATPase [Roseomonas acroporae]MCK8785245.1 ParA family protein [Roseomonas acroporae]
MAFVVALAQRKGGVGKSTVAANLAVSLGLRGQRVAILDTDPQKTLRHWHEARERSVARQGAAREGTAREGAARGGAGSAANAPRVEIAFEDPSGWRVPGTVERLRRSHDVVMLDTPPHSETDTRLAIRAADLVLVPLQPSPADLWATDAMLELALAEKRPAVLLLNRVPATGKLRAEIGAELKQRGLAVMPVELGNRTAYASAFLHGLGVAEASPRSAAATEMAELAEAMLAVAPKG